MGTKGKLSKSEQYQLERVIAEAREEGFRDGVRAAAKVAQGYRQCLERPQPDRIAEAILALLEP